MKLNRLRKIINRRILLFDVLIAFSIATCAAGMIALGRNDICAGVTALATTVVMVILAERVCSKIEKEGETNY